MMEKMREKVVQTAKVAVPALSVALLSAPVAFADGSSSGAGQAMQTAFNGVKDEFVAAVGLVAPIAIAIAAAPMIWKLGINFFKSLVGRS